MHEINLPDVVAEVAAKLAQYEQALFDSDTTKLNELFWAPPRTLRFGIAGNLYGHAAISAFRMARIPDGLRRQNRNTVITAFGHDFATVNVEYEQEGRSQLGRMTHTWVRIEEGWRIVAAHVSFVAPPQGPQ
jgi:hypothetical protein